MAGEPEERPRQLGIDRLDPAERPGQQQEDHLDRHADRGQVPQHVGQDGGKRHQRDSPPGVVALPALQRQQLVGRDQPGAQHYQHQPEVEQRVGPHRRGEGEQDVRLVGEHRPAGQRHAQRHAPERGPGQLAARQRPLQAAHRG